MFRSKRYIRPRSSDKNFCSISWNIISIILRDNSCLSLIHPIKLNLNTNIWYKFNYSQHSTSLRIDQKTHSIKKYIHISYALNLGFHNIVLGIQLIYYFIILHFQQVAPFSTFCNKLT